jgi:segregation and condensation protein B
VSSKAPPSDDNAATVRPEKPLEGEGAAWDAEAAPTVNLTGDMLKDMPIRDDLAESETTDPSNAGIQREVARAHLRGLVEALVFASDRPIKASELAKAASAPAKEVREALAELKPHYAERGIVLEEIAGGWLFRTNPVFAPFVRDLTREKPVRLTRAQVETLAILAYRQPITRPEIDEIRGVDSGPVLKLLLERDLVRILGKKDEPGRPILYGTTSTFLEFFALKSLGDLPTLHEFTELNEESRRVVERELGDVLDARQPESAAVSVSPTADSVSPTTDEDPPPRDTVHDTIRPASPVTFDDETKVSPT